MADEIEDEDGVQLKGDSTSTKGSLGTSRIHIYCESTLSVRHIGNDRI